MDELTTHSFQLSQINQAQLERFAQELAFALRPGDVISLTGDLGAGKTTLARALIRALTNDLEHEVPSPTFTLVREHQGRSMKLYHLDLYRLDDPEELENLGYEVYLDPADGASVIEWPERAGDWLPERFTLVRIEHLGGDRRLVTIEHLPDLPSQAADGVLAR